MGMEPTIRGKSCCEIVESKIINYNNETRWIFEFMIGEPKKGEYFLLIIIE